MTARAHSSADRASALRDAVASGDGSRILRLFAEAARAGEGVALSDGIAQLTSAAQARLWRLAERQAAKQGAHA